MARRMDRRTRARFDALAARMAEAYARVPEQEGMARNTVRGASRSRGRKVAPKSSTICRQALEQFPKIAARLKLGA
jgi:hypothetical protein